MGPGIRNTLVSWMALGLFALATMVAAEAQSTSPSVGSPAAKSSAQMLTGQSGPPDFNYILGPSDVLHIEVLNHPDFNVRTTIGADDKIQLPYIGSFPASNMTVPSLRERILAELKQKGIFSDVSLQIEVLQYASRFVTVLGGVANPGLIPVDRAYHLSEMLARVGGVKETSSSYVILGSKNGREQRISVEDLATGGAADDPLVSPGDKIYVPTEVFYIKGQVKAPGAYSLPLKMTLAMALARGGGLTDAGSTRSIKVTRNNVEKDVSDLNFKIEPNDVIDVGTSWF